MCQNSQCVTRGLFFAPSCNLPLSLPLPSFPPPLPFSAPQIDKSRLKQGSRVALDMTTLTIMRQLLREVDPLVHNMSAEDPGEVSYASVGGLADQIRELREVILYLCGYWWLYGGYPFWLLLNPLWLLLVIVVAYPLWLLLVILCDRLWFIYPGD